MRAACLLIVLVTAKCLVLGASHVPMSGLAPLAYFWQDALVALAAGAIDAAIRRPSIGWVAYAIVALYVAINVPIALVLSSPLTWPMIHAAGGPLADSIAQYLTFTSLASVAAVAITAGIAPIAIVRGPRWPSRALIAVAGVVAASGFWASARVDTAGLERNAVTALIPVSLPDVGVAAAPADWRDETTSGVATGFLRGAARGRNVVVIVLESTAARYLEPYGAAVDPMPNLTRMSARAVLFENAYAAYPESIKGLWSTLCSKYPAFGVDAEREATVPCASIAGLLATSGYRTGLFHSGRFGYLGMDAVIRDKGFHTLEDAGAIGGHVRSSFGVDEPATISRMLAWIDAGAPHEPFFLTYLPVAGHHPYATPSVGPFPATTEAQQYLNALHYADESLGALVDGLRARRLYNHTIFVVFGDHGEAFEQHPGNAGHTFFVYDENIHVPLLIAVPGVTDQQLRSPGVASLIDVAPTVLDALGLPLSPQHQGSSLLRPGRRMALFLTDYSLGWLGLRDGCFKYMFEIDAARSKLFDVCRDPREAADMSASGLERARVERYRDRVQQWSAAVRRSVQRP